MERTSLVTGGVNFDISSSVFEDSRSWKTFKNARLRWPAKSKRAPEGDGDDGNWILVVLVW
jgi:hypothetical protein